MGLHWERGPFAARHRLATALLACACATAAAAAPARAPAPLPAVLHLADAVRLADEQGFDVLLAEAAVGAATGDAAIAGAVQNPALSLAYGRSFTYRHCTDAQGNPASCGVLPDAQYGVGLSDQGALLDALSGKRALRVRTARAALAAAQASRDDARRVVRAQAKLAFLQAVMAKEALALARDVAAASARSADLTRARYEAGAISEADVARVDVARLEAEQAADSAAGALREAKIALALLLGARGDPPDFDVEEPALLDARRPASLEGATPERLLDRAREARPDLAAARRQRERAEAALALARRQRFPDVAISLQYAQQGTTSSAVTPPTLTAGVALPLPLFYRQQGEVRKAEAELRTQQVQAEKVEAQVAADLASGLSALATASGLTDRMHGALLDRARRARDLVAVQYQKGAASLLDFLDAQRTLIATSVERLQDLALFWGAVIKLEEAVGEELR